MGSGQDNNRRLLLLQNWIVEEDGDARTVIAEMLESLKNVMPLSEENVFNFRVVMSELVNNEFRHGTGRNVHISISAFSNRQVEMYVYGSPKGFDLDGVLKRKERKDSKWDESGRGLLLAEALCESLRIDYTSDGSVMRARMHMQS